MHFTRRSMLLGGTALAAQAAMACSPARRISLASTGKSGPQKIPLIDAHCHLFNITDLPASSFMQVSFFEDYEQTGSPSHLRIAERILRSGVPTAKSEYGHLNSGLKSAIGVSPLSKREQIELDAAIRAAEADQAKLKSVKALAAPCYPPGSGPKVNARSALRSLHNLRASRKGLTRQLISAYAKERVNPILLCPALVDYSHWLSQRLEPESGLDMQVRAMGAVARQPDLRPVHGYAPYDPLRHAMARTGMTLLDAPADPIALLREAVTEHGFIGVKLYPPMGFRGGGNAGSGDRYPARVEAAFGGPDAVAKALDDALGELWGEVEQLDISVMAHGYWSNQAGCGFGRRADPHGWLPIFERHPKMPIMLAHFGAFKLTSSDPEATGPFESSWEGTLARYIRRFPGQPIYGDISYLSEIWDPVGRARAIEQLKLYRAYDEDCEHLVYASDWFMIGIDKRWYNRPGYAHSIIAFLEEAGITGVALRNILVDNALRFLQLGRGQCNRVRLERFHAGNPGRATSIPFPST